MREIRTYGSEGGAAQTNASSLPLSCFCYLSFPGGRTGLSHPFCERLYKHLTTLFYPFSR